MPTQRQCTESDGWIHVIRGPKAVNRAPLQSQDGVFDVQPEPAQVDLLQRKYDRFWIDSPCRRGLEDILNSQILRTAHLSISNCVCLGLGSIVNGRLSSQHQLATLKWMLNLLRKHFAIDDVGFYDPALTAADINYLDWLGFQVDPSVLGKIDASTFLFAPHLEHAVFVSALTKETPALCVGNDVKAMIDQVTINENDRARPQSDGFIMSAFLEATESSALPPYDRDPWCYFTRIYWRKTPGDSRGSISP